MNEPISRDQLLQARLAAAKDDAVKLVEQIGALAAEPPPAGSKQELLMRTIEYELSSAIDGCDSLRQFVPAKKDVP